MATGLPVLPILNGFSVHKKPTFATGVMEFIPGNELTVAQQAYPLWEFELTYEILRTTTNNDFQDNYFIDYGTEYESILVMFLLGLGQGGRFNFSDPSDNSRTGQFIAMGDGHTHVFRLMRDWGTGSLTLTEPIGELDQTQPFQFYVNGSPVGPGVLPDGASIDFGSSPPANGTTITGDFFFYYKCRFMEDTASFEEIMYDRWGNKSLKFRSVKDDAPAFGIPNNQPVSGWRVYQLLVPGNLTFDSFSYGCCSLDGLTVVGTAHNVNGAQLGVFWKFDPNNTTAGAEGGTLQTDVPKNYPQGTAFSTYQTFATNSDGTVWAGWGVDPNGGKTTPVFWKIETGAANRSQVGDASTTPGELVSAGAQLLGVSPGGANACGFTQASANGNVGRACYMTTSLNGGVILGVLPSCHIVSQLQNGKLSEAVAIGGANDAFLYGWDTDNSNLIHAVRWARADGGAETLLDVPGGNLYSACFAADEFGDYSCGKVITGAGQIQAIYWLGTSTHTILSPLGAFQTIGEARGVDASDTGQLFCGISANGTSGLMRATAWMSGTPVELPLLVGANPASDVSEAWGCNGDGNLIVGTCTLNGLKTPCIWRLT